MSKVKIAVGAIVGAAAGFLAGILTAPKSGKETRSDIAEKANEIKDDSIDKIEDAKTSAGGIVENIKDKIKNL